MASGSTLHKPEGRAWHPGETSTRLTSCRTRFNDLVNMVNEKIQAACKTVDRCVYVDSEAQVDKIGGRMCMPGVNENYYGGVNSPTDGWNRERTIFYEWYVKEGRRV